MREPKGYVALVLHAHLPFVRHPEHENHLEEDWLYEAITETYIPVLEVLNGLEHDGVPWMLTMSLTPPLIAMLHDELLQRRYVREIEKKIELAGHEIERLNGAEPFSSTARMYKARFERCRAVFADECGGDLVRGFAALQRTGRLEIITCGATHGFLPILNAHPPSVRAQIRIAQDHYTDVFGRPARGIWLPECAYAPGIDAELREAGIEFFFLDAHGILDGRPPPVAGVYRPVYTAAGTAAFARDPESSRQVWSADEGYPGDGLYREFYRDLGWDAPLDYIRPYIQPTGERKNTGLKFHRIGAKGDLGTRPPYVREWALERTAIHARHFMFNRERQIEHHAGYSGAPPIVTSPYDAELFGHWWYEGPEFLDRLFRAAAREQGVFAFTTPPAYLDRFPAHQQQQPAASTWGAEGYSAVWLNDRTHWMIPPLIAAGRRMSALADAAPDDPGELHNRALAQAVRELLLAQSSDWPFIVRAGTMAGYAWQRVHTHLARFTALAEDIESGRIDPVRLAAFEADDNLFPHHAQWRWYRTAYGA